MPSKKYSQEFRAKVIDDWSRDYCSITELAKRNNLNINTVSPWIEKHCRKRFVPKSININLQTNGSPV